MGESKVYDVLQEMLTDRGYQTSEMYETFDDWKHDGCEGQVISKGKSKIFIYWSTGKIGTDVIKKLIVKIREETENETSSLKRCILVIESVITAEAKNIIKNLRTSSNIFIEVFTHDFFAFNRSRHVLVPKHRICPSSEMKEILEKYKVDRKHMPTILSDDVQNRYLGGLPGQMIRIERKSETMGEPIFTYKIVK
jgi:DNA-directed RNA polymerase I, II, and III subunit RPABC1